MLIQKMAMNLILSTTVSVGDRKFSVTKANTFFNLYEIGRRGRKPWGAHLDMQLPTGSVKMLEKLAVSPSKGMRTPESGTADLQLSDRQTVLSFLIQTDVLVE